MLQDAANVNVLARFPWMLLPAAAIFLVTLSVNLALGDLNPRRVQNAAMRDLTPGRIGA